MNDADLARLRRSLHRGRRIPWLTFLIFPVSVYLIIMVFVIPPFSYQMADSDQPLSPAGFLFGLGLLGFLLSPILIWAWLLRSPAQRHAKAIEKANPGAIVVVAASTPSCRTALRALIASKGGKVRIVPIYFCVAITAEGVSLWDRSGLLDGFTWKWGTVKLEGFAFTTHMDYIAGVTVSFPALDLDVPVKRSSVVLPVVGVGRGLAGAFSQSRRTMALAVQFCADASGQTRARQES